MTQVLDGVRVIDFCRYIAGPFCTAMLADLGAEAVMVEAPARLGLVCFDLDRLLLRRCGQHHQRDTQKANEEKSSK